MYEIQITDDISDVMGNLNGRHLVHWRDAQFTNLFPYSIISDNKFFFDWNITVECGWKGYNMNKRRMRH